MEKLFSYGTLQLENVQKDTFSRILIGSKEILMKYVIEHIKITDQKVILSSGTDIHPILKYTGDELDVVEGMIFDLTNEELLKADKYEVDDYKREKVVFKSGKTGFVYLKNEY